MAINPPMIPGANFTSNTKNYPWHRPPQYTDISECLDLITEKIATKQAARKVVGLADLGIPLYRIAMLVVMEGIETGKWTVDMALLLAGPVTKIIEILCIQYGVEYDVGIEDKDDEDFITAGAYLKGGKGSGEISKDVKEALPDIKADAEAQEEPEEEEGLMSGFAAPVEESEEEMTELDDEEEEVV